MKLYIIRGLPGSGKTTKALDIIKLFPGTEHYEADMWFLNSEGEYKFNSSELKNAHAWCKDNVYKAMCEGKSVIVSNTFVKRWEYMPYVELALEHNYEVEILVMSSAYKSIHGVPDEKIAQMKKSWEH